ncbi:prophage tail fiber N-terminal domain-containing protein [Yersinia ruckeri]|uniref:phage tail fiber protein n=1 Tax=Yersinia ruckeri TaxID=29486 RepID=UPI001F364B4A|nr:prophage tail fiber N-terminal domain-containing protein [Yersinia ruckeri]UIN00030.1 prophage tail fiber N-terminal domain-containing protein [Yersinia ruckeri]
MGDDGRYSFTVEPGKYGVTLHVDTYMPRRVGEIVVRADAVPGTLNDFLGQVGEEDLTPAAILKFEAMVNLVAQQAAQVERSKASVLQSISDTQASQGAAHGSETASAGSAAEALVSKNAAKASELAAAGSAAEALSSKNAAAGSATEALTSKNAARASELAAADAVGNAAATAAQSVSDRLTAAVRAEADRAASSVATVSTSERNAATSERNAAASDASATQKASQASSSAEAAASSATIALTKANEAYANATRASVSEQNLTQLASRGIAANLVFAGEAGTLARTMRQLEGTNFNVAPLGWCYVAGTPVNGVSAMITWNNQTFGALFTFNSTANELNGTADSSGRQGNWYFQYYYSTSGTVFFRRRIDAAAWTPWSITWTGINTTVDANGFIKRASPIVKLSNDGACECNEESEGVTAVRRSVGVYVVSGTLGLNADGGWFLGIPKDDNGQALIWVDYDVEANGDLIIRTFHRENITSPVFARNLIQGVAEGDPIDIPRGRVLDLRVHMPDNSVYNQRQSEIARNLPEPQETALPQTDKT